MALMENKKMMNTKDKDLRTWVYIVLLLATGPVIWIFVSIACLSKVPKVSEWLEVCKNKLIRLIFKE